MRIENSEFTARIAGLRKLMARENVDLVMAFSNLLDPSAVRYYTDFASVNESAALIVPIDGQVTVCSGQASSDYCVIKNRL